MSQTQRCNTAWKPEQKKFLFVPDLRRILQVLEYATVTIATTQSAVLSFHIRNPKRSIDFDHLARNNPINTDTQD
jgi:hypothetical protein